MKIANKNSITLLMLLLTALLSGCDFVQGMKKKSPSSVNSTDGSSINYGVCGSGNPTLVFVHCWTCSHELWKPQLKYFSQNHRVVWLDLAGHGGSGSNRLDYTMRAFGEDVAAVVNAIDATNVVLVGHSMGGPVAIEAAALLGDKVTGIVGVDTFYTPFVYPQSAEKIDKFVKPFKDNFKAASEQMVRSMFTPAADPGLIASTMDQLSVANKDMGVSAMYELFRWSAKNVPSTLEKYSGKLRNINAAPTGNEKPLNKNVVLIPGAGHFVAQVKPDEFNRALNNIISGY